MSILGLSSTSFVQGFDTKKSNLSKLTKLSSLLSSSGNFLQPNYGTRFDSKVIDMGQECFSVYNTVNTDKTMGSKMSHTSYYVPSAHYEVRKPTMNIIGGYVGAKIQQNREPTKYCIINDILMHMLPNILSENLPYGQIAESIMEIQAEQYTDKEMADFVNLSIWNQENVYEPADRKKEVDYNTNTGIVQAEQMENVHNKLQSAYGCESQTYASVVPASPSPEYQIEKTSALKSNKSPKKNVSSVATKNAKNRRKRKKRRRKQQIELEKRANHPSVAHAENCLVDSANNYSFSSLCNDFEALSVKSVNIQDSAKGSCSLSAASQNDYLFDYCDEVDSSHVLDEQKNSFKCQNNTISFILNGNDELSDSDSDWSCDTLEVIDDGAWESFKENFECFQNLFVMESFCTDEEIPQHNIDCELEDEDMFFYVNEIQLDNGLESSSWDNIATKLKDVNEKWNYAMKDVVVTERQSKVSFPPDSDLIAVHYLDRSLEEIRSESWDCYHLDHCRFQRRIQDLEPIIAKCFDPLHRLKVWEKLQSVLQ